MSLTMSPPVAPSGEISPAELKEQILRLTRQFSRMTHRANRPGYEGAMDPALRHNFVPGQTSVPYAGRVFTEDEVEAAVSSTLDFWLTLGKEGESLKKDWPSFWVSKVLFCVTPAPPQIFSPPAP